MKFTLSWLKDHLDTNASLEEISKTLTAIGLEVEQVIDRGAALKDFTVAKILQAEPHPQADKLRVCKVQSDIGELQIVCGAPNARAGIYVVLAKEGALIPANGMVIKKTKIRGVESNGMLCSAEELALPGDSSGIIELSEAPIGESVVKTWGLDDPLIDIAITPNRADCLGVRGIARDLAAAGLGTLKDAGFKIQDSGTASFASPIHVAIENPQNCPQFIGCTIKGVKNGASPDWMQKRLEAIGQRPISALVDITNYIMFDLGRPLHVYDAVKLRGNLMVRNARLGEKLKALDGKDYTLSAGMTVIADDSDPVALGGIIGGEATSCTGETTDVFLEVALFNPAHVAATGRALGIESDARYRFERGVDVDFVETAAQLATHMISDLCGGQVSELTFAGSTPSWQRSFLLRRKRIATLGGVDIPPARVESILKALGFSCMADVEGWIVSPPSWRGDIEGEADVLEEVLRIEGYDQIPAVPLPPAASKPLPHTAQNRLQAARRVLAGRGFLEACSWSFLPETQAKLFGGENPQLKLLNPISADLDTMRPSLLPNLLDAARRNEARRITDFSLFEAGLQFSNITPQGQHRVAAGIRLGSVNEDEYYNSQNKNNILKRSRRAFDPFDTKTDACAVLSALGVNIDGLTITTDVPPWYHPGRSGALTMGKKIVLGYFGEIHPRIAATYDLPSAAAFEIFLDAIPQPRVKGTARPSLKLSEFQPVERDFAFIVEDNIAAADILKTLSQADKQLITHIEIFDVYQGVAPGKKSVAVRVTLQAMDRTLSEQDIAIVSNAIITTAAKGFGGQLRQ